jgi:hypothetical protein
MELSPSWGAANCAALQELPSILWNPRFNTVFTRALHWSLSWAISIQSTPSHSISQRSILILSWSSQWSFSSWLSHQYPICIPLLPHSCYMLCPSHPPWLDHSDYTWRRAQVMKLLIMQFSPTVAVRIWVNSYVNILWATAKRVSHLADAMVEILKVWVIGRSWDFLRVWGILPYKAK